MPEKTSTYKVGDRVMSMPKEIERMGTAWRAVIHSVRHMPSCGSSDGFVYETLGKWDDDSKRTRPTLRQLWADRLRPDDSV